MANTDQVLNLAAIIREVDGNNRKGAAALAESILDHPRFRAALADGPAAGEPASVTGQFMPTDAELLCIAAEEIDGYGNGINPGDYEPSTEMAVEAYGSELCAYARAVLARWGNPAPQPPAEGEVEELVVDELVKRLRTKAATEKANRCHYSAILLTRAANLLEQRHPTPVPVSERLPGDQLCWWLEPDEEDEAYGSSWTLLRIRGGTSSYTHWLPATALPLPGQEVEG